MHIPGMMYGVAFGPLNYVTQPNRCSDIGMLKNAEGKLVISSTSVTAAAGNPQYN